MFTLLCRGDNSCFIENHIVATKRNLFREENYVSRLYNPPEDNFHKLDDEFDIISDIKWSYERDEIQSNTDELQSQRKTVVAWWRHQMETFSALLAPSPVTGEFPEQRPVTRSFDVFFDLRLNKRLSKQSWNWWFETPSRPLWRHFNGLSLD